MPRILLFVGLGLALLYALFLQSGASQHLFTHSWDFPGYYVAARRVHFAPQTPLYAPYASPVDAVVGKVNVGNGAIVSRYNALPELALILEPFSRLGLNTAYHILWISNYILLALTCFLLSRKYWFIIFVATVCSYPFFWLQYQGQFGVVILFLWVAGTLLEEKGRSVGSALCFSLATLIKLTPAVIVLLFIIQKKWRWLAAYFSFVFAAMAVGIAVQGWQNHLLFWDNMRAISMGAADWNSLSISGIVYSLWRGSTEAPGLAAAVPAGLMLVMKFISFLILLLVVWRKRESSSVAAASLAIAPFVWCHYFLLAVFPFVKKWRPSPAMIAAAVVIGTSTIMRLPTHGSAFLMAFWRFLVPCAALFLAFAPERKEEETA